MYTSVSSAGRACYSVSALWWVTVLSPNTQLQTEELQSTPMFKFGTKYTDIYFRDTSIFAVGAKYIDLYVLYTALNSFFVVHGSCFSNISFFFFFLKYPEQ